MWSHAYLNYAVFLEVGNGTLWLVDLATPRMAGIWTLKRVSKV